MSNAAAKQDDVTNAADKLMKKLLDKANAEDADVDFSIQVMQTCSRYLAVKGRINVPDEGNAFDGFRDQLSGERGDRGDRSAAADDRGADLPSTGDAPRPRAGSSTPSSLGVREARTGATESLNGPSAVFTVAGHTDADLKPGAFVKSPARR